MSETNGTGQTPETEGQSEKLQAYIAEFFAGARIGRGLAGNVCSVDELKRRFDPYRNGAVG